MSRKPLPLRSLTAKEKMVLEFIETYLGSAGIAPSYQEIKDHFGFASFNSVQRYLKQLQSKKYIYIPGDNQKRAITILQAANTLQKQMVPNAPVSSSSPFFFAPPPPSSSKGRGKFDLTDRRSSLSLPLLGRVAAGRPLEALEHDEFVDVPGSLVQNSQDSFALRVQGQSMIEEGILDGDTILVRKQGHAKNGDIIVASVDNEATVKRFYLHDHQVELRPANSNMKSLWFTREQVKVQGVVVGLIRKF